MVDDLISDDFRNWEHNQSSNLLPHLPSSENQKIKLQQWSMVAIRDVRHDHDCSVFPPINHENLSFSLLSHQYEHAPESPSSSSTSSSSSSSSRSSFSPSDTDTWGPSPPSLQPPSKSQVQKTGDFTGWMNIGLQILRSKAYAMVTSCQSFAASKGAIGSIAPLATAVITLWWMYTRVRRWLRWRRQTQRENNLMTIIKQKDEVG